jgi:hypothetical protein
VTPPADPPEHRALREGPRRARDEVEGRGERGDGGEDDGDEGQHAEHPRHAGNGRVRRRRRTGEAEVGAPTDLDHDGERAEHDRGHDQRPGTAGDRLRERAGAEGHARERLGEQDVRLAADPGVREEGVDRRDHGRLRERGQAAGQG